MRFTISKWSRLISRHDERLVQRILKAGFWITALRVVTRGLGVIRIVILARLLSPADFGIMGVALLVIALTQSFSQIGFQHAIVQKKGDINGYLDTAWTVSFVQKLVIGVILVAGGGWIASFFDMPTAVPVIQAMGAILALNGLTNIGVILFTKELDFHKSFLFFSISTFADLAVSISSAVIFRNVWALVFGALASCIAEVALSFWLHPYRPRFYFDVPKARELFGFGRWLLLYNAVYSLASRMDSFVVGKVLGANSLGSYQVAQRVSDDPISEIQTATDIVAFPVYSKMQDDLPALRKAFFGAVGLIASVAIPLAVLVFLFAPNFTRLILGEKWMPAVPAMQILAFAAALRAVTNASHSLYLGTGRPHLSFYMNLLRGGMLLALIFPLTVSFGIKGSAWAMLLSTCSTLPFLLWFPARVLRLDPIQLAKTMVVPVSIGILTGAGAFFAIRVAGNMDLLRFGLIAAAVVVYYVSVTLVFWRWFNSGPVAAVLRLRT